MPIYFSVRNIPNATGPTTLHCARNVLGDYIGDNQANVRGDWQLTMAAHKGSGGDFNDTADAYYTLYRRAVTSAHDISSSLDNITILNQVVIQP